MQSSFRSRNRKVLHWGDSNAENKLIQGRKVFEVVFESIITLIASSACINPITPTTKYQFGYDIEIDTWSQDAPLATGEDRLRGRRCWKNATIARTTSVAVYRNLALSPQC